MIKQKKGFEVEFDLKCWGLGFGVCQSCGIFEIYFSFGPMWLRFSKDNV